MKILIIQLARLGDIYQSWPALRALRRSHPTAKIEVVTRARFAGAWEGLSVVDGMRTLPSKNIMEPLLDPSLNVKEAYDRMSAFVDELKAEKYDWVLNFSFSPFSSFLTHAISDETTKISGYTRTSDGFLAIPDDMSAYFYAQVGIGKPNRYHLAEIFGTLVESDLIDADWAPPSFVKAKPVKLGATQIVIHVGASESKKAISPVKWTTIINRLLKINNASIKLIGAANETPIAEQICASVGEARVESLVGKTTLAELFQLIHDADVVVGADSAPMHMAGLTSTPCVNLSLATVNFWETGPRSQGSVILRGQDETDLASDKVAQAIERVLNNQKQELSAIVTQKGAPSYWLLEPKGADFEWNLVQSIYMQKDFPPNETHLYKDAVVKLTDINLLMVEQIEKIQNGGDINKAAPIIDRGEEIIDTIGKLVPAISPLIRWYQTEKIRIGPNSQEKLLARSLEIQNLMQKVLDIYLESYGMTHQDVRAAGEEEAKL